MCPPTPLISPAKVDTKPETNVWNHNDRAEVQSIFAQKYSLFTPDVEIIRMRLPPKSATIKSPEEAKIRVVGLNPPAATVDTKPETKYMEHRNENVDFVNIFVSNLMSLSFVCSHCRYQPPEYLQLKCTSHHMECGILPQYPYRPHFLTKCHLLLQQPLIRTLNQQHQNRF